MIASASIDVKDGTCREVCPVECIYEGGRMMYIQPGECISCGLCLSVCPVDAIWDEDDLPAGEARFRRINAGFFGPEVIGWGEPGGASQHFRTNLDHAEVARAKGRGTVEA
ncbi:MAG TPA: ferredoxin family protein [Paracoccaceae bacterium]|nr:ferredoxin family protein [Paracoccaceae bacterium]